MTEFAFKYSHQTFPTQMFNEYSHIKTWKDLIENNIAYLEGNHNISFYNYTNFQQSADYKESTYKIEKDLLRLHKEFAIFTYYSKSYLIDGSKMYQRSCLSFVCQKNQNFVDQLLADERIFTFVRTEHADGTSDIQYNCPDEIKLTIPFGSSFSVKNWEENNELLEKTEHISNISTLLEDAMHIFVCVRDFPKPRKNNKQATQCVLEALEGRK